MKPLFCIFVALVFLAACQPQTETNQVKSYFDLKGFIESQLRELEKRKPTVDKKMSLDGESESKQTNEINWAKELDLFIQADINKQAYQSSYEITQPMPKTNLYSLKKGENQPVQSLKVTFDDKTQMPSIIEVSLKEENKLYDSEKQLRLTCGMRPEGVWLIKTYEISGFQHLSLTDKKSFSIVGTIY